MAGLLRVPEVNRVGIKSLGRIGFLRAFCFRSNAIPTYKTLAINSKGSTLGECMKFLTVSIWLAVASVLTLLPMAVNAGFAEGSSALDKKDYATALREFRAAAIKGDAKAQYNLGYMFEFGQGVTQDTGEAMKWYRLAADQGLANAQYAIGLLFDTQGMPGLPDSVMEVLKSAKVEFGVPKDYEKAMYWYRLAAEQGFAPAESNLGTMFAKGHGVAVNYPEAVRWFRLAAEKGYALGLQNLAACYLKGYGVAPNKIVAHSLFILAARGDRKAALHRDEHAKTMRVDELEAARMLSDYMHQSKSLQGSLTNDVVNSLADRAFSLTAFKREFAKLPNLDSPTNNLLLSDSLAAQQLTNRPTKTGEMVYMERCSACHSTGIAGSPRLGDKVTWAPRIKTGMPSMLSSVVNGKGAMGPQVGNGMTELDVARATVFIVNKAGGQMPEPKLSEYRSGIFAPSQ